MINRIFRGKTPYVLAISAGVVLIALFFSLSRPDLLRPLQNLVFDFYQQLKPRDASQSAVVVIDIDEPSIAARGQWPWPRSDLAELTDRLSRAGAAAIAFDMVFSEPDRTAPAFLAGKLPPDMADREATAAKLKALPDHDAQFAAAISRSPAVLAFFDARGQTRDSARKIAGVSWLGEDLNGLLEPLQGAISSLPVLVSSASGHGHISLGESQTDDVVRRIPLFAAQDGNVYPALSAEALRVALQSASGKRHSFLLVTTFAGREGGEADRASGGSAAITMARLGNFTIPLTKNGGLDLYFAPADQTSFLSADRVLSGSVTELADKVGGKIALVGASAAGLRDIRTTILREAVPGVAIHAQVIDQIMQGKFLNRPDWAPGAEAVLAVLLSLAIIAALPFLGALSAAAFGMACAVIVLAVSWWAFSRHGLLIDPLFPLLLSLTAYFLTTLLLFAFADRERRFIRTAFRHYIAPNLLTRLEENPDALKLGGEIRDMTVMFMDVRNFTPLSENLTPEELVTFLNNLLSPLSDIIQRHEGAIDKYIGDAIMAFWNAPLDVEDHGGKACLAALEMLEEVEQLNERDAFGFRARGLGAVAIGIGISTGPGCVGNLGSTTRFDYSVVGDTVNVASRLEAATKDTGAPILVSQATASAAPGLAYLPAGKLDLKGKTRAEEVFVLAGNERCAESAGFQRLAKTVSRLPSLPAAKRKKAVSDCLAAAKPYLHPFLSRFS
ncbi:CHASE2 domain-containing protein [Salaquimonas pukyongi]|uniref:CHASE2 domain-containing protein n=1 Tax=Salaquimonas pukyongi TaxID=2712698 RepID=UPI0009FB5C5B|nr:adenylate/guanylate cyclase domain-containing protein [Salaquimonas pukyongi]